MRNDHHLFDDFVEFSCAGQEMQFLECRQQLFGCTDTNDRVLAYHTPVPFTEIQPQAQLIILSAPPGFGGDVINLSDHSAIASDEFLAWIAVVRIARQCDLARQAAQKDLKPSGHLFPDHLASKFRIG